MNEIERLKIQATRQYRHNDDNSPDQFSPRQGFVIAYDKDIIDKGLEKLQAKLDAMQIQLNGTIELGVKTQSKLDAVAELPDKWRKLTAVPQHPRWHDARHDCADDLDRFLKGSSLKAILENDDDDN